eukprot:57977_1
MHTHFYRSQHIKARIAFRQISLFSGIQYYRCFSNINTRGKHNKNKDIEEKDRSTKLSQQLGYKQDRIEEDFKRIRKNPQLKARPFSSEFNHVRNQINNAKSSDEVLKIVDEYKNAGDLTIITKAMWKNTRLLCGDKRNDPVAQKQLFEMWNLIDKAEIKDCISYNILLDCCNKLRMSEKCDEIWIEMLNLGIQPSTQTLGCMTLAARGNVSKALKYFEFFANNYGSPEAQNYESLFLVCAEAKPPDVETAEKYFFRSDFPYRDHDDNLSVCKSLMRCYVMNKDIDRVQSMINRMEKNKIVFDAYVYKSIIMAYIDAKDPQKAIDIYNEAEQQLENNDDKLAVFRLIPTAYCELISITTDLANRKKLLNIVAEKLPNTFREYGEHKYPKSIRWGLVVLDATMKTYNYDEKRKQFGWRLFEEIAEIFDLPYFDATPETPECYLKLYDIGTSEFILFEYLPEKKIHLLENKGLIIQVNKDNMEYRFQTPSTEGNVGKLLKSKGIQYTVNRTKFNINIVIDKSEIPRFRQLEEDEPLFG